MTDLPNIVYETEAEIVSENNSTICSCGCTCTGTEQLSCYGPDRINVFDVTGRFVGYSWNYGDSVELVIDAQDTILRVAESQLEELKVYLSDKTLEVNFINMRGEICYTFTAQADLQTTIKLNTDKTNTIAKNTYTCTLVLVNPKDNSRINLLFEPYRVYVI